MRVLAILQNQWFNDPDGVRKMLARHNDDPVMKEKVRRRLITYALFAGCRTGRILKKVFGKWTDEIIWEESSREIGSKASSCFPPDREHLAAVIAKEKPNVVIAFGKNALTGIENLFPAERLLIAPHPTARGADILPRLRAARMELDAKRAEKRRETMNGGECRVCSL